MLERLHRKFVASFMIVSTLLLVTLLVTVYSFLAIDLRSENIRMMQSVDSFTGGGPFAPDAHRTDERLHYFVLARTPQNTLVVMGNTGFDLDDSRLVAELFRTAAADTRTTGVMEDYALRYQRISDARGEAYIFSDISDELASLASLRRGSIAIGVVSLLVLYLISNLLAKWMIRPVAASWEQQKQFVADASHELKTPLTVISTNTELLTSPDCSNEEKLRLVEGISAMSGRMRQLVEGLLDLARVDSGVVKSAFDTVDYSDLVEQSLLPFEPAYFESGRMLESDIAPGLQLRGSARHLAQVTDILLDNAMKYSHEGSTVRLSLQKQGRHALLCVDSPGVPLSPEQCKDIFRRFYTVDKARTGDSYGLGLSIAQAIVEEHGGTIWAESTNGQNRFYVKLPI